MRPQLLSAFTLATAIAFAAPNALADDIDRPTILSTKLNGSSSATGTVTTSVGFPAYTYTASKDGFVRVELETSNLPNRQSDNGGVAWRPYLRVVSISNPNRHGEAWSTNGDQKDPKRGYGMLVFRIRKGESFTVITTLAQNFVVKRPDATANYKVTITEVSP